MKNGFRRGAIAMGTVMFMGLAGPAAALDPGVGVGAPGVGAVDPGLNQPGVAGNVGGVARRSARR